MQSGQVVRQGNLREEAPPKNLLVAEAVVAGVAGLALVLIPSLAVSLTFGSSLTDLGTYVGRGAGVTLLALGMFCWMLRDTDESRITTGLIAAILFYDIGVAVVLLFAHFAHGMSSAGLWLAVVVHFGLGIWCFVCLVSRPESRD